MNRPNTDLWLDISDIPQDGLDLQLSLDPSLLKIEQAGFTVVDSVSFLARAIRVGPQIVLQGRVSMTLELFCSRCLETFTYPSTTPFALNYYPWKERKEGEEEVELEESDLDACYYMDEQVSLLPAIQEQVILSVPLKPLCFPDCRGLCQRCGHNLNVGSCTCQASEVDERLLILKKFQKRFNKDEGQV